MGPLDELLDPRTAPFVLEYALGQRIAAALDAVLDAPGPNTPDHPRHGATDVAYPTPSPPGRHHHAPSLLPHDVRVSVPLTTTRLSPDPYTHELTEHTEAVLPEGRPREGGREGGPEAEAEALRERAGEGAELQGEKNCAKKSKTRCAYN